ncbi:hypothetical protein L2E82_10496 [Cichorium intybus]|uniref:Uncharacterized protein n=1 Tax=Cichorium intybus TaxID=13427 RepID=A0ACB9GBU6_CICIN|nr:hypothetical protein L2E82_10496 [Cichorium intybus]
MDLNMVIEILSRSSFKTIEQRLIVFESSHPTNNDLTAFHVCKPTTNQFQALPDPEFDYSTCKAAIVIIGVEPLRYKIFRVSYVSTWELVLVQLKKHISAEGGEDRSEVSILRGQSMIGAIDYEAGHGKNTR